MAKLSVALLGAYQATLDNQPLTKFRTNKAKALLIYLLVEEALCVGHVIHQRDALLALLWPHLSTTSAQANLRQALYHLSHLIPPLTTLDSLNCQPLLLSERQTVEVNPYTIYQLDVIDFWQRDHLYRKHNHANAFSCADCQEWLTTAVSLYRGDFLADFTLPNCNPFEEWALMRREQLRRRALTALKMLTDIYLHRRAFAQARTMARKQLAIDDLRDVAYRQLMEALARDGQCCAALGQYERCCEVLTRELNVRPAEATTALAAAIRAGDIATETPFHGDVAAIHPVLLLNENDEFLAQHDLPTQSIVVVSGTVTALSQVEHLLSDPLVNLIIIVRPSA